MQACYVSVLECVHDIHFTYMAKLACFKYFVKPAIKFYLSCIPNYVHISSGLSENQSINQSINQWTVSPMQEVVLTITMTGIRYIWIAM